jgi:hypothetical protein
MDFLYLGILAAFVAATGVLLWVCAPEAAKAKEST